jgi:phosphoribosylanthranilate isomerase
VRVKICGITSAGDARVAVEAGADAIGLVFAESPRQVTVAQAARIVEAVPPWVSVVGVFVDAPPEEIAETARRLHLGVIQFHGDEMPCLIEDVATQCQVVKAFRIATPSDLDDALDYLVQCRPHACLVDSRVAGVQGGSGRAAPWSLVAPVRREMWPLILSGGLTPENVAEAVRIVQPFGVESSSGVERSPGRKDADRVREFVKAALSVGTCYPEIGEPE